MVASITCTPANAETVRKTLIETLEDLPRKPLTAEEVDRAKTQLLKDRENLMADSRRVATYPATRPTDTDVYIIQVWNVESFEKVGQIAAKLTPQRRFALSADGRYVLTVEIGLPLRRWDVATGRMLREFPLQTQTMGGRLRLAEVNVIAVSPVVKEQIRRQKDTTPTDRKTVLITSCLTRFLCDPQFFLTPQVFVTQFLQQKLRVVY